jgi:hypothetical protein
MSARVQPLAGLVSALHLKCLRYTSVKTSASHAHEVRTLDGAWLNVKRPGCS